ncbi:hypothetical protein [Caulobacter sp. 17J65-9]|uniref:hypothetical protein n=1 Tax=Caulobacter sp. 17J65-9 TaxID=2709382 RepID=UPI0013CAE0E0|nr:hypothetical protein [Caulobacter sp. 17J65-9]NEX94944.1 hypothetical protein [Caulobacter sp. 17J65-9]
MRLSVRGLAGLVAGIFVCAGAAQAQPLVLADADMDQTTAGFADDLFASDWLTVSLPDFDFGGATPGTTVVNTHTVSPDGSTVTSYVSVTHVYTVEN